MPSSPVALLVHSKRSRTKPLLCCIVLTHCNSCAPPHRSNCFTRLQHAEQDDATALLEVQLLETGLHNIAEHVSKLHQVCTTAEGRG